MKKAAIAVAVLALAILMVLPVVRSVNLSAGKSITIDRTLSADGWPQPPLPPKQSLIDAGTFIVDGWPQPPLPPKASSMDAGTLVADGWPQPPLPPPPLLQTLVSA